LWLSAPQDSLGRCMPDLTGLAVREALRRLTPLEVIPHLEGHGVVVRQSPAPGAPIQRGARCDLWCAAEPERVAAAPPKPAGGLMAAAGSRAGGRP
jgi:beta-lactam-binding protein with PASTA domain